MKKLTLGTTMVDIITEFVSQSVVLYIEGSPALRGYLEEYNGHLLHLYTPNGCIDIYIHVSRVIAISRGDQAL